MIENSMIIPAKIAATQAVELHDLKMEQTTVIRKAAR